MTLKLASISPLIEILRDEGVLSTSSMDLVVQELDNMASKGTRLFAGELAVRLGVLDIRYDQPITQETVDHFLAEQTTRKAEAAVVDIITIREHGTQDAPPYLRQVHWGNNGVNPARENPTNADAISAAANCAQIIVTIANLNPTLANDSVVTDAIDAAAELARGIMASNPDLTLKSGNPLLDKLESGLKKVTTGKPLLDRASQPINIDDYIGQRFIEIRTGIQNLSQQKRPGRKAYPTSDRCGPT